MSSPSRAPLKLDLHLCRRRLTLFLPFIAILTLLSVISDNRSVPRGFSATCSSRSEPLHGGDCEALREPRRPTWACTDSMKQALPKFISLYNSRPVRNNTGGVMFDHAFALWYTLRMEQPKTVIESGAFKGLTTWIIRTTLPTARIISLDPAEPSRRLKGVEYLTDKYFNDFSSVDWATMGVDPKETLVFLDDHQSSFRRIFLDNKHSFRRFIAEDNYGYLEGDNVSLKWVCELTRKSLWAGSVRDNFGKNHTAQSWEQHLRLGEHLKSTLRTYYEFPPVASMELTHQRRYDEKHTTPPIVKDAAFFEKHLAPFGEREFAAYTHFCFVELMTHS